LLSRFSLKREPTVIALIISGGDDNAKLMLNVRSKMKIMSRVQELKLIELSKLTLIYDTMFNLI